MGGAIRCSLIPRWRLATEEAGQNISLNGFAFSYDARSSFTYPLMILLLSLASLRLEINQTNI